MPPTTRSITSPLSSPLQAGWSGDPSDPEGGWVHGLAVIKLLRLDFSRRVRPPGVWSTVDGRRNDLGSGKPTRALLVGWMESDAERIEIHRGAVFLPDK